ncbi:hypothetical protein ACIPRD_31385 [Streptomyces sp. NPDC090108]
MITGHAAQGDELSACDDHELSAHADGPLSVDITGNRPWSRFGTTVLPAP